MTEQHRSGSRRARRVSMVTTVGALGVALMLGVLASLLGAQDEPGIAAARAKDGLQAIAFADSSSVRVEVTTRGAGAAAGTAVTATITDEATGARLWSGSLGTLAQCAGDASALCAVGSARGLAARLWSPETPVLYALRVTAGTMTDAKRIGFRTVRSEGGRVLLNGRPLFLRGNAINPPGRNLPDSLSNSPRFARQYLRSLKANNVNLVRFTSPSPVWLDAADEVGMLVFQGNYGTPLGATPTSPPKDVGAALRWYRESVIGPQASHPSVVIYVLANEQSAPEITYLNQNSKAVGAFLQTAYDSMHAWDATRLYIGNAGYGFGRAGELCDLHRYWGWYYNSALSFYTLRDPRICWRTDAPQPITLTEAVGNYTGPDGRYNLASNTKQPESQLNWTGHAPDAEQGRRALAYQAWTAGQAIEIFRRLRERNPYLAGLSPFTILFGKWEGIRSFSEMAPKPIVAQYKKSYQPVLLSWELWTPQAYAGATIHPVAHVVNDAADGRSLGGTAVRWTLRDASGAVKARGTQAVGDVPYYAAVSRAFDVTLPEGLPTGTYSLGGELTAGGRVLSRNDTKLWVARAGWAGTAITGARRLVVYDDTERHTYEALRRLGVPRVVANSLGGLDPARDALVIGAGAWNPALTADTATLRSFLQKGGRVVVLEQDASTFDASWLPAGVHLQTGALDHPDIFPGGRPFGNGMSVNPERASHPALAGLTRERLFLWSDPTRWDESKPGFPPVYPVTHGYALTRPQEMQNVAVLANYDHGLHGVALAEFRFGAGTALLSGFETVSKVGLDPAADRLLLNLVRYATAKAPEAPHMLMGDRIVWGDYSSEHGLVTGVTSGLLLNTVPRVPASLATKYPIHVDEEGFWFAGGNGGWNTKPAIQYFGRGRRAYGPYDFSAGGAVRLPKEHDALGEGRVWLRTAPGRTRMTTTIENPADSALAMEIGVNGATQRVTVPAHQTASFTTALGGTDLALTFRGDRRLVLRETRFQ